MKKSEAQKKGTALVKSGGNGVEKSYAAWIADLKRRYRATQIKAAVAVNSALIEFYWNLGKDIAEKYPKSKLGNEFYRCLSADLRADEPTMTGLSPTNLKYSGYFYRLYSTTISGQQLADLTSGAGRQLADFDRNKIVQQLVAQLVCVPWGHHN